MRIINNFLMPIGIVICIFNIFSYKEKWINLIILILIGIYFLLDDIKFRLGDNNGN
jgi:hypothetical protein